MAHERQDPWEIWPSHRGPIQVNLATIKSVWPWLTPVNLYLGKRLRIRLNGGKDVGALSFAV